jgi:hypothetical protein
LIQGGAVGVAEPIGIADAATVLAGYLEKHLHGLAVCYSASLPPSNIQHSAIAIEGPPSDLSLSSACTYVFMLPALSSSSSTLSARCPALRGTNNGIPHLQKAGNFVVHQKTISVTITSIQLICSCCQYCLIDVLAPP